MPNRALIIAIEKYGDTQGAIAAELPGVHASARSFFDWLMAQKLAEPEDIFVCSDGLVLPLSTPAYVTGTNPPIALHYGATQPNIVECIRALLRAGTDQTENLFVFCAGHGFAYSSDRTLPGLSYLITSEFTNPEEGGGACINIDLLQRQLGRSLSGKRHFHFIDACRNILTDSIQPTNLPIPFSASNNGQASCFAVYSARLGAVTEAGSEFSDALIAGLSGFGYGKQWIPNDMDEDTEELWITFAGVHKELQRALNRTFDRIIAGSENDAIYRLAPVPKLPCTIRIDDPDAAGEYDLVVRTGSTRNPPIKIPATGYRLDLEPGVQPYGFDLSKNGVPLERVSPRPGQRIDMFVPSELIYQPSAAGAYLGFNPGQQAVEEAREGTTANLDEALLLAMVTDRIAGVPSMRSVAMRDLKAALLHDAKSSERPQTGLVGDVDPMTWLACAGIALAYRPAAAWTQALRMAVGIDLPTLQPGESALLFMVLGDQAAPRFAVHDGTEVSLQEAVPSRGIAGLFHAWKVTPPGAHFFSIQAEGGRVVTFASRTLVDHVTVVTAHLSPDLQVQQFFPPSAGAPADRWLMPMVRDKSGVQASDLVRVLATARVLAVAQASFLERKAFWNAGFVPVAGWDALESGTWFNLELLSLCAFDAARQGRSWDLSTLVSLGIEAGPFAVDIAWLAGLSGEGAQPMLLDSLLMAGGALASPRLFPFPANRLDYRAMWISWRAVVTEA